MTPLGCINVNAAQSTTGYNRACFKVSFLTKIEPPIVNNNKITVTKELQNTRKQRLFLPYAKFSQRKFPGAGVSVASQGR